MSSSSLANELFTVTQQYSFYSTLICLIFGFIGNMLNIIVFLNLKIFQEKQYGFYLIMESLVNTMELIFLFLIRVLIRMNNGIDPGNQSLLWCKLRIVIGQPITLISFLIVCFASYDQFLSTSHRFDRRQMSTYKLAQYLTLIAACLCMMHTIPFGIFLNIDSSARCAVYKEAFNRYYQFFYYLILAGILPISVSSFFSFLAFRNVRRIVQRQIPIVRRRLDQQLTAMSFIRTAAFIILVLPYIIHRIYWLQITLSPVNLTRYAIDSLILVIMVSLFNLNFGISFYVFFISSSRFRHQVKVVLVKKLYRRWKRWQFSSQNQVAPVGPLSTVLSVEKE